MAPIHDAAVEGNLEEVMRLIEEEPDVVDAVNEDGATALLWASGNGHVEVVSCLSIGPRDIHW